MNESLHNEIGKVKEELQELARKREFLQEKLVEDLRGLSKENDAYVSAYLQRDCSELLSFAKYKKIIYRATSFDPLDEMGDGDYDFEKCERALKGYLSASGNDQSGYAELLIYTIEQANQITLEYGDMGEEGYYEWIEDWYEEAAKLIALLHDRGIVRVDLVEHLQKVMESTDGMGWGYHDALVDLFCEYLGNFDKK